MDLRLATAAALLAALGAAHSFLGERYILTRLFRRGNLPKLLGGEDFTRQTLRFAWHLTTVACVAMAVLLVSVPESALAIGVSMLVSAALTAGFTRGRHLAWIVMLAIAALCAWASW